MRSRLLKKFRTADAESSILGKVEILLTERKNMQYKVVKSGGIAIDFLIQLPACTTQWNDYQEGEGCEEGVSAGENPGQQPACDHDLITDADQRSTSSILLMRAV